MKQLYFIFFLFALSNSFPMNVQAQMSRFDLTVAPTILSRAFALQPGVEYHISPKYSVLTEAAIPFFNHNDRFDEQHVFRLQSQVKMQTSAGRYVGLQLAQSFRNYYDNKSGFYKVQGQDSIYRYSVANVSSPVTAVSLQFGRSSYLGKAIFLEAAIGLGARWIHTRYQTPQVQADVPYRAVDNFGWIAPDQAYNYDGDITRFHAVIALRVGSAMR